VSADPCLTLVCGQHVIVHELLKSLHSHKGRNKKCAVTFVPPESNSHRAGFLNSPASAPHAPHFDV